MNNAKKCGAKLIGKPGNCDLPAGWGTDHIGFGRCRKHMGKTRALRVAAHKEASMETWREMKLGQETDISPLDAMLWTVRLSAGAVSYFQNWTNVVNDALQEHINNEGDGDEEWEMALDTLMLVASGLGKLYGEERDRLTRTAKMCIDVGIAERQVQLAEAQGDLWALMVAEVIDSLVADRKLAKAVKSGIARKMLEMPTQLLETTGRES